MLQPKTPVRRSMPPNTDCAIREGTRTTNTPSVDRGVAVYGAAFWFCYAANALLMLAVSLLFRYADFVSHLGGTERHLGAIVGVGMIGALAVRVSLGVGIDTYGPRLTWLASLAIFSLAAAAHLIIDTVDGPAVYLVRILMTIGIAGSVGASLTYVSLGVPESRIAEMVGTIGTSGFVGLALGPVLGDFLFHAPQITREQINRMFLLAAVAGLLALAAALAGTRQQVRERRRRKYPPLMSLIRRYHPGAVLVVALAMGLGIGLPGVFVRAYAAELNIIGIQTYFLVYATVAFAVRIVTRRLSQQIGARPVILAGLGALSLSMLLYLLVNNSWQLAFPAIVAGSAHALLFPAVVASGSTSFPSRYRGLATTLVLGMFDLGNLFGQPAVGNILHYAHQWGLPKYPTMFVLVALLLGLVAVIYAHFSQPRLTPRVSSTAHELRRFRASTSRARRSVPPSKRVSERANLPATSAPGRRSAESEP